MREPKDPDRERFIRLNRPQGTVIGDFAHVVNNFFSDPHIRNYTIAVILVLGLILGSLWVLLFPVRNAGLILLYTPTLTTMPVLTSTLTITSTPGPTDTPIPTSTPAPTFTASPTPLYTSGLFTFIVKDSGAYTLYALSPYGDRVPLLDVPGATNLKILVVSPAQEEGFRYLAVQYELDGKPVLSVVSSDGQKKTTINEGNAFGRVIYLPDGSLLADIREGSSIIYKRFAIDGSNPVTIYSTQIQSTPSP